MFEKFTAWRLFGGKAQVREQPLPRRAFVYALLEIYERYGVYIGGQLILQDVIADWDSTGFRKADIGTALNDAVAWNLLEIVHTPDGEAAKLLATEVPISGDDDETMSHQIRLRASDRALQLRRLRQGRSHNWDGTDRRSKSSTG